jgi:hypothetical protein
MKKIVKQGFNKVRKVLETNATFFVVTKQRFLSVLGQKLNQILENCFP